MPYIISQKALKWLKVLDHNLSCFLASNFLLHHLHPHGLLDALSPFQILPFAIPSLICIRNRHRGPFFLPTADGRARWEFVEGEVGPVGAGGIGRGSGERFRGGVGGGVGGKLGGEFGADVLEEAGEYGEAAAEDAARYFGEARGKGVWDQ